MDGEQDFNHLPTYLTCIVGRCCEIAVRSDRHRLRLAAALLEEPLFAGPAELYQVRVFPERCPAGHSLKHTCSNVVGHLGTVKSVSVRQRQVALFALVDPALGQAIASGVNVSVPSPLPSFPAGPTWYNTTKASNDSTLDY